MQSYGIDYTVNGRFYTALVDAKDAKSAKKKITRKHEKEQPCKIVFKKISVIGFL